MRVHKLSSGKLAKRMLLGIGLLFVWRQIFVGKLSIAWFVNSSAVCVSRFLAAEVVQTTINDDHCALRMIRVGDKLTQRQLQQFSVAVLFALEDYASLVARSRAYDWSWPEPVLAAKVLIAQRLVGETLVNLDVWRDRTDSQTLYFLANTLFARGQRIASEVAMATAYEMDEGWQDDLTPALAAFQVARQLKASGQWDQAAMTYHVALSGLLQEEGPSVRDAAAAVCRDLGEISEAQGDLETAIDFHAQSALTSPREADFHKLASLLLTQGGTLDDVYAFLADLRQRGPHDDPYLWANSAAVFRERGALDQMARILAETPMELADSRIIRGKYAQLAADRGEWSESARFYQTLLEEAKLDGDSREIAGWANALGEAGMHLGRGEEAVNHFEAATRMVPSEPSYWFNLGQAYGQQGKIAEATAAFERALELRPNYEAAQQALSKLEK